MRRGVSWCRARGSTLKWKGEKSGGLQGRFGAQVAQWCEDQWWQLLKLYKEDKNCSLSQYWWIDRNKSRVSKSSWLQSHYPPCLWGDQFGSTKVRNSCDRSCADTLAPVLPRLVYAIKTEMRWERIPSQAKQSLYHASISHSESENSNTHQFLADFEKHHVIFMCFYQ